MTPYNIPKNLNQQNVLFDNNLELNQMSHYFTAASICSYWDVCLVGVSAKFQIRSQIIMLQNHDIPYPYHADMQMKFS